MSDYGNSFMMGTIKSMVEPRYTSVFTIHVFTEIFALSMQCVYCNNVDLLLPNSLILQ